MVGRAGPIQSRPVRKSIQNRLWERPRGTQNQPKIAPWTLSGRPMVPNSVPKVSQERLGSVLGRLRHALASPGESARATRDARKSARIRPGVCRGDANRRLVASGSEQIKFHSCGSFAMRWQNDFSTLFIDFRPFRQVREPSKVPRLPAETEVRPFALGFKSLTRWNLGLRRKWTPDST